MKHRLLLVVAFAIMWPVGLQAQKEQMPYWMTGAWVMQDGKRWADEYWTPPRAGIMIGASRLGEDEKLQFWEHMRITREPDGTLAFWAVAADQKPVRFPVVKNIANEIVFENPSHDYPQRIRYWREGQELKAQISLIDGGRAVEFEFGLMDD